MYLTSIPLTQNQMPDLIDHLVKLDHVPIDYHVRNMLSFQTLSNIKPMVGPCYDLEKGYVRTMAIPRPNYALSHCGVIDAAGPHLFCIPDQSKLILLFNLKSEPTVVIHAIMQLYADPTSSFKILPLLHPTMDELEEITGVRFQP